MALFCYYLVILLYLNEVNGSQGKSSDENKNSSTLTQLVNHSKTYLSNETLNQKNFSNQSNDNHVISRNCTSSQKTDVGNCLELDKELNAMALDDFKNGSFNQQSVDKAFNIGSLGDKNIKDNNISKVADDELEALLLRNATEQTNLLRNTTERNKLSQNNSEQNSSIKSDRKQNLSRLNNNNNNTISDKLKSYSRNNSFGNLTGKDFEHGISPIQQFEKNNDTAKVFALNQNNKTTSAKRSHVNKDMFPNRRFNIPKLGISNFTSSLLGKDFSINNLVNNTMKNVTGFIEHFNISNPVDSVKSFYMNGTKNQKNNNTSGNSARDYNMTGNKPEKNSESSGENKAGISDIFNNTTSSVDNSTSSVDNTTSAFENNTLTNMNASFVEQKIITFLKNLTTLLNRTSLTNLTALTNKSAASNLSAPNLSVPNLSNKTKVATSRDEVNKDELSNHTAVSSFTGEISKLETGTSGRLNTNGSKQIALFNETDRFSNDKNDTFTYNNVTSLRNCSGCLKDNNINNASMKSEEENENNEPIKKCKIQNSHKNEMNDMKVTANDYDSASANINCIQNPKEKIINKLLMRSSQQPFKRRLISNHVPQHKNNNTTNDKNDKVDEKIEDEKNKDRQASNKERAQTNDERSKELEKTKYKILNGIHDEPSEEPKIPDERGGENKTIPMDPSMLPEQFTEPVTEDNKDALVGIMGIDNRPAIEKTNNTRTKTRTHSIKPTLTNKNPKNVTGKSNGTELEKNLSKLRNDSLTNATENLTKNLIQNQGEPMKKSILCFGDSLTKGYYENGLKYHPYSIKLKEMLEDNDQNTEYQIDTEGVNGECVFNGMKERLPILLNETFPLDLVIILGGTNDLLQQDCAKGLDLYQEIKDLHEICHERGIKTAVVTIPEMAVSQKGTENMSKTDFTDAWGGVNQKLRVYTLSKEQRKMTILIDLADEFSRQNLNDKTADFWDDNIHPSVKGYDKIGEIIYEDIKGKF